LFRDRVEFADLVRRKLQVDFSSGAISSDGGQLLREVDRHLKLTERVAEVVHDPRDPNLITHRNGPSSGSDLGMRL
jgi:hypothetical protein